MFCIARILSVDYFFHIEIYENIQSLLFLPLKLTCKHIKLNIDQKLGFFSPKQANFVNISTLNQAKKELESLKVEVKGKSKSNPTF